MDCLGIVEPGKEKKQNEQLDLINEEGQEEDEDASSSGKSSDNQKPAIVPPRN